MLIPTASILAVKRDDGEPINTGEEVAQAIDQFAQLIAREVNAGQQLLTAFPYAIRGAVVGAPPQQFLVAIFGHEEDANAAPGKSD